MNDMNSEAVRTLQEAFDNHEPLLIFPFGLRSEVYRPIGDGFVYPEGVCFMDVNWPKMDTGNPIHFVEGGNLTGPYIPKNGENIGFDRRWTLGKAIIYRMTDEALDNGVYEYISGERNQNRPEKTKKADRKLAKGYCDEFVAEILAENRP